MASIYGFQMKNIKNILGREGYGCTASLYLNGKKIGRYADYGDGAMGNADYDSPEAEKDMMCLIIAYAKNYSNEYIINMYEANPELYKAECERFKTHYPYIPDEDITIQTMASNSIEYIVEDFLELYNREKEFKKYRKKGYKAVGFTKKNICAYPETWSDTEIKKMAKKNGETLYMSLDDFVIS